MSLMFVAIQVACIQSIENKFPVQIDIDRKSKKIQIQGQAESMTSVVEAIHSIFHDLDKEERNQLEAEVILKEVIANFTSPVAEQAVQLL